MEVDRVAQIARLPRADIGLENPDARRSRTDRSNENRESGGQTVVAGRQPESPSKQSTRIVGEAGRRPKLGIAETSVVVLRISAPTVRRIFRRARGDPPAGHRRWGVCRALRSQ